MARGYLYEISTNPNLYPLHNITPDELANDYRHEFEFVTDTSEDLETKQYALSDLLDTLKQHHFLVKEIPDPDDETKSLLCFTATKEGIHSYFQPRFESLKQNLTTMTLEEFLSLTPTLQDLLDNQYNDAVYLDTSFYTFDAFLRNLLPGQTYYVGNILLMH